MQRHKTQEVAQEGMLFTDSVGVEGGGGCFFYKWFLELELLIEVATGPCSLPLSPGLPLS